MILSKRCVPIQINNESTIRHRKEIRNALVCLAVIVYSLSKASLGD